MREAIRALPDGTHRARIEIDGYDEPLAICLAVTVADSEIVFDYTGTSPQQARAINVPMTNTYAMTAFPAKCLLDPHTPRNDGSYRPIKVIAPAGCLVNPTFPAPVNARHLTFLHLASAVFQAMAAVVPDRIIAESGTPLVQIVVSGQTAHRDPFVYISFDAPGMGARSTKDGLSTTPYPNNVGGVPVEVIETTTSLLVHERSLVADSGGPGRFRGGLGVRIELEQLGPGVVEVSVLGDRIHHPARGVMGGLPGMCAAITRNGVPLDPKGRTRLGPGDRISFRNAGGGGYGPSSERSKEAVAHDLAEGYVTREGSAPYG
jgi:N-methylhydantoinase B